jgi:site-specific recombinase XerD
MIAAAEGEGTRSIRDRAMLAAALRRSELVGLQLADPALRRDHGSRQCSFCNAPSSP